MEACTGNALYGKPQSSDCRGLTPAAANRLNLQLKELVRKLKMAVFACWFCKTCEFLANTVVMVMFLNGDGSPA